MDKTSLNQRFILKENEVPLCGTLPINILQYSMYTTINTSSWAPVEKLILTEGIFLQNSEIFLSVGKSS